MPLCPAHTHTSYFIHPPQHLPAYLLPPCRLAAAPRCLLLRVANMTGEALLDKEPQQPSPPPRSWTASLTWGLAKLLLPPSSYSPSHHHPLHPHVSLNALLDSVHVLGLNAYDVLTLLQALAFHYALYRLCPWLAHPWLYGPILCLQLAGSAWAYRAFLPYVSAKEGGKRDLYRFSLLTRPHSPAPPHSTSSPSSTSSSPSPSQLSAPISPSLPSSPPFYSTSDEEDGSAGGGRRGGQGGLGRASSAAPLSTAGAVRGDGSRISDVTERDSVPALAVASPGRPSPLSMQGRRLSTSETISALKRPLLHARSRHSKLSAFQSLSLQTLNPFVNRTFHISAHEHIRLSLAMAFLFPFRISLFMVLFIICYLHCKVCILGVSLDSIKTKPLAAWRRRLLWPVKLYCRVLLLILGYAWIGAKGKPASAKEAPMVVCNHVGFVEPIFLITAYLPSPVGAVENLTLPIAGVICQALQAVPVHRLDRASRGELVRTLKRRCESAEWPQIVIFPEGTTTNGQALITFKSGAFIAGTPVQPVLMRFPSGSRVNPAWVSCGPSPAQLVLRLMAEPFSRAYVEYLPVHRPTAAEKADANLFAANVRAEIARALQVPTTNHSYEDALLAEAAWTSTLFQSLPSQDRRHTTSIELSTLHGLGVDLDAKSALLHLRRFTALDTEGRGRLSYEQLTAGLGVKDSPEMRRLFEAMDEQDTGSIDFREYLLGLSCLSLADRVAPTATADPQPPAAAQGGGGGEGGAGGGGDDADAKVSEMRLRLLCRLLDVEDTGSVHVDDLVDVLSRTDMDAATRDKYTQQLGQGGSKEEKSGDKESGAGDGFAASTRAVWSYDELLSVLRSDAHLSSHLLSSMFSPLPTSDVAQAKVQVAEAVVEKEEVSWRKKIKAGVGRVVKHGVGTVKRSFS